MILYFSGTGNSEYVAKRIGKEIGDETLNLFEKIRSRDNTQVCSSRPWVVVVPTYAWKIPRIVQEWLECTALSGSRDIYFVMTCGGSIGNAGQYLQALCAARGWNSLGCLPIVMPENYLAMFSTPTREEALEIIQRAEGVIDGVARTIQRGEAFPKPAISVKDRISSGIVNQMFYPLYVHAKKFRVTDACISCGRCVEVCPRSNIRLEQGRPVWGDACTHCMACICRCPSQAIEYGTHSKGLARYTCPKQVSE